jgi:hypothetical protein
MEYLKLFPPPAAKQSGRECMELYLNSSPCLHCAGDNFRAESTNMDESIWMNDAHRGEASLPAAWLCTEQIVYSNNWIEWYIPFPAVRTPRGTPTTLLLPPSSSSLSHPYVTACSARTPHYVYPTYYVSEQQLITCVCVWGGRFELRRNPRRFYQHEKRTNNIGKHVVTAKRIIQPRLGKRWRKRLYTWPRDGWLTTKPCNRPTLAKVKLSLCWSK